MGGLEVALEEVRVLPELARPAAKRRELDLGTGPILCKRTVGNLVAVVHIVPFGGLTAWRPDSTPVTPQKRAAVAFAGSNRPHR